MAEWTKADLTDRAGGPAAAGAPFGYLTTFNGDSAARIVYRGQDAHIHELRLEPGSEWKRADLTDRADGPDAAGDPYGYATPSDDGETSRVLYRSHDNHIHELRLETGGEWQRADLSARAGAPNAAGKPCGYTTTHEGRATARVVYRGNDAHLHELRLDL